jgi:hypothetical protein
MELLYLQFASFRIKASAEYHAQRNKKLEAIMRDHQHQARVARISRPITPQSSRAEDLDAWRAAQVKLLPPPLFVFSNHFNSFKLPRLERLWPSLSCQKNSRSIN